MLAWVLVAYLQTTSAHTPTTTSYVWEPLSPLLLASTRQHLNDNSMISQKQRIALFVSVQSNVLTPQPILFLPDLA